VYFLKNLEQGNLILVVSFYRFDSSACCAQQRLLCFLYVSRFWCLSHFPVPTLVFLSLDHFIEYRLIQHPTIVPCRRYIIYPRSSVPHHLPQSKSLLSQSLGYGQGGNDLPSAWRNGRASDYSDRAALLLMSL